MRKISLLGVLVVFLMMVIVGCSGKSSTIEGKVVDGKGQPLANVKVAAKMSQPIKGYEQFETKTGTDGSFKFSKLFPTSEYQLFFYLERWVAEKKILITSGLEKETKILSEPVTIRFMDSKSEVILDTKTNLLWAVEDNAKLVDWMGAKSYCENYRAAGYADWRMPTMDEITDLFKGLIKNNKVYYIIPDITVTGNCMWVSDTNGSDAAFFDNESGYRGWKWKSNVYPGNRVLPVRSAK